MQVLDLNKFRPEPKTIELGDKSFLIKKVPFEIALGIYDLIPTLEKMEKMETINKEEYGKILSLILEVLQIAEPDTTLEWLKSEMTLTIFRELTPFIFSIIFNDSKKNEGEDDSVKST